ncbi:MAG TPA: sugar ABC transporter ATP-binding protein [Gaiellaceae bacterium]|jgi:ABC-type sugar transport system ATPase subunit
MSRLDVRDLHKRYGALVALAGTSLSAYGGELHALLGENGAGKSTLIRTLSGVVRPDAGTIVLDGKELQLRTPVDARRMGIRTVFQELSQIPDLSVAENLLFESPPLSPLGRIRAGKVRSEARALLDRFGIVGIDADDRVGSLGFAERQLLEVVKALRMRPRVLILDEATSALSAAQSDWVLARAREVADDGAIVLLISHRLAEVRSRADRITVLRSGLTIAEGAPADLDDDAIIEAMLGRRIERLYVEKAREPGETVLKVHDYAVGPRLGPLSFDVRAGEIFGIGALQGQGQRQLVMGLGGALRSRGEVTLQGRRYAPRSPRHALRAGVALVPEDRQREGLFLSHSIRRNMSISSLDRLRSPLGGIDLRRERRETSEQARRMKLPADRLDHPVSVLSGGNQQKVVLAKMLLTSPKMLLLYDCTRGVDVGTKAEIFQAMAELADAGVVVVFYSSDLSELVHMCDRVAVLAEGKLRGILERGELSEERILRLAVGHTAERHVVQA